MIGDGIVVLAKGAVKTIAKLELRTSDGVVGLENKIGGGVDGETDLELSGILVS